MINYFEKVTSHQKNVLFDFLEFFQTWKNALDVSEYFFFSEEKLKEFLLTNEIGKINFQINSITKNILYFKFYTLFVHKCSKKC